MMYLSLDKNQIKLLLLKKTLLGQYEASFYEKSHQVTLLENGKIPNTDLLASAVKEAITSASPTNKDKEVTVVLPQEAFQFLRADIPKDMATTAINSFIRDKARVELSLDIDSTIYDYQIQENDNQQQVLFFSIDREILKKYVEAFTLLNLQLVSIVPEAFAYFKLFEKTLRKDKREYIIYTNYEKKQVISYFYDSFGLLDPKRFVKDGVTNDTIEELLKKKATEYENEGKKANRLILSGDSSEGLRQDTFTKNVGVWTNPLKRIIPNFYQDYLKILVLPADKPLLFLMYDVCIGAFIFSQENRNFSFFKKRANLGGGSSKPAVSMPKMNLPYKSIGIFLFSSLLTIGIVFGLLKLNVLSIFNNSPESPIAAQPTTVPTQAPSPTPLPEVDRSKVKVKVLNGSGTKGQASQVKDLLKEKGYEEILTDNADNFDYTITEIQVKKGNAAIGETVKKDIQDSAPNAKITVLDDEETADVVIIFGKDFK